LRRYHRGRHDARWSMWDPCGTSAPTRSIGRSAGQPARRKPDGGAGAAAGARHGDILTPQLAVPRLPQTCRRCVRSFRARYPCQDHARRKGEEMS
jgi:hypothetical protein